MDVDLLRPGTVPISPDTSFWYEFLLNPHLFINHLNKKNADPSAIELIIKFLTNSHSKENDFKTPDFEEGTALENIQKLSLRTLALKILSVKVAAFLNWDIDLFEAKLPLHLQGDLLYNFLFLTSGKELGKESQSRLDLNVQPDHVLFAISLFNRWILKAVMNQRLNTKVNKQSYNSIPGLQDSQHIPPNIMEEIRNGLERLVSFSLDMVKKLANTCKDRSLLIPIFDSFVMLSEDSLEMNHRWDIGRQISSNEFQAYLRYDAGCYHFFRQEYKEAGEEFTLTLDALNALGEPLPNIPRAKVEGYVKACFGRRSENPTLLEQLRHAVQCQYMGTIGILTQDNIRRQLSQSQRNHLEIEVQAAVSSGRFTVVRDYLPRLQTLNIVGRIVSSNGLHYADHLAQLKQGGDKFVDSLLNALVSAIPQSPPNVLARVSFYLHSVLESGRAPPNFFNKIMSMPFLSKLFTEEEILKYNCQKETTVPGSIFSVDIGSFDQSILNTPHLQFGHLERRLIHSYEPEEIKNLIIQMGHLKIRNAIWKINNKWELPIPLQSVILTLPAGFTQDYWYILVAKSRELAEMRQFTRSNELLGVVKNEARQNNTMSDSSLTPLSRVQTSKLEKLVGWELLLVRIAQFHAESISKDTNLDNLTSECKQCLSAVQEGDSVIPRSEILDQCAICLLNLGQWDYLCSLDKRVNYYELTAACAHACQDLIKFNASKKLCKDAWELVLPAFGPSPQQYKRNTSGHTLHHRDSPTAQQSHLRASLAQFLSKLRDTTVLGIMISLLARLHNVLKDEPSQELMVDNTALWPAVVSNANSYQSRNVGESLSQLLLQAIKYYPSNVSWLKALADLHYVSNNCSTALRYYLESCIVSTSYFNQPIGRTAIDDHVFKRMILCCIFLHCHTQAAVLCQFLEEVDYTTAFKCLSDIKSNNCGDAMDSYYPCIWDTTILEFLVNLHTKRGEQHRKQQAIKVISLLELNANNNEEIQREAANIRKSQFLRAMARQYVL